MNINGMANTIRVHLSSKHRDEWRKIVVMEKLKGWAKLLHGNGDNKSYCGGATQELPFTHEGFLERLVRWIAVDDQVDLIFFIIEYCY
jgi:hypothetical protein